jgi:hypothetical protein
MIMNYLPLISATVVLLVMLAFAAEASSQQLWWRLRARPPAEVSVFEGDAIEITLAPD